ncbi:uncharacterized protein LOC132937423 [Metopolophium dirhodum]|uniref:uncharacterized protein LOC132937423 n=1 Tax=Metopolophium dirhodum TaxID=44670 RepID=UPI0029902031|nr:uncharacterized protein LOC132937423 [Metopolophium dirhodum]
MENNTNNNGNARKSKSVRFTQEPQVFVFQSNNDGEPIATSPSPLTRPEQGSVRERARRYDQNVAWRSIPLQPRPPALPPRNPVRAPVNRAAPKPLPPKPLPRAKNDSTVTNIRQKVRIFRRCPDTRPITEGREVMPLVPHYRMKVPDTPPPPPPSSVPLAPLALSVAAAQSARSTPSTSSTPSAPSVDDDDDNGIRVADQSDDVQTDGTTAADGHDDDDRPGCIQGCILFIVGCFSCIIG